MALLLSAVIFFLAYRYLDRDSLIRKIIMIWTGIILVLSVFSIVFSIVKILLYVCIIAMILMFVVGLFKKTF